MFGIGPMELAIVVGVAVLLFGPSQLPKLGRALGQTIKELRGAGKELRSLQDDNEKL